MSLILLFFSFVCLGNANLKISASTQNPIVSTQTFDVDLSKIYAYEITQTENTYSVLGKFENETTYILCQTSIFENIITQIDQDRFSNNLYEDCVINFNNITLGNSFLVLNNGNYTLQGNLTGFLNYTNGLIYINGASVEICNAEFTNNGTSYLIKNVSGGSLEITNSILTATDKTIYNVDGGNIWVFGGKVESLTSSAIFSSGTASINIQQNSTLNPTEIIGNTENFGTIYASGGAVNITGGIITNLANGYAVYTENTIVSFANLPTFAGNPTPIYTETAINGQVNGEYYSGETISILFGGEIASAQTILVQNTNDTNKNKFQIANANYDLKFSGTNLIIYEIFSLIYYPNATNIDAPTDTNKYFMGDTINLQFLESGVRAGYVFLGWAEMNNATSATYAENGETQLTFTNQTLYAVWQAIEYSITYVLNGGEWAESVVLKTTYTCETPQFILPKPIKEYHTFLGFSCENNARDETLADTINNPNRVVPSGTIGDLIFTAYWELTVYNINYNGLTSQIISALDLTTGFTIESPSITISSSDFLYNGYSFFGIYVDAEKTQTFSGEVCFDITAHEQSPEMFDENGNINFYILTKIFHNGQGGGTAQNPYVLSTIPQFEALLTGYKKTSTSKTYVILANNITFLNNVSSSIFEPLSNFDINGNNYTINIGIYNTYNNYTSLFPYLKNCNLHNINFNATQTLQVNFGTNAIINFANIVGLAENTNFENVNNYVNVNLINSGTTQIINFRAGGIVLDFNGENSSINNCYNYGNITILIQNNNDININCGTIAGLLNNSLIINSANYGNANLSATVSNPAVFETRLFASGIAILEKDSSVINCFNQGNISLQEENNNLAVASGVAIIFNTGCKIYNVYNLGEISVLGTYINNISTQIAWSSNIAYTIEKFYSLNTFAGRDFTNGKVLRFLNGYIPTLAGILESDYSNSNVEAKKWYYGFDLAPQFAETILVNYNLNGVGENKSVVYYLSEDIESKFTPFSYRQNFFEGWFTTPYFSTLANFENLTEPSITLFAKWTPLATYVNNNFEKYIVAEVLIFMLFLTALYFFDKKKTVKFFNNGKLIAISKVARTKPITLPKGFENMLWFEDVRGQKPFTRKTMPHKKMDLFTFNDSKQQRMENKYYNDLDNLKQQELQKAQAKQKQLEEKQAKILQLKEQKNKEKAQKEQQRAEAVQLKQKIKAEKQAEKQKQQQTKTLTANESSIDDRITIIKKEIKIIDTNKDK